MAQATDNSSQDDSTEGSARRSGWRAVAWFGLSTLLISLILSWLATPWLDLSWWKVFRRCASIAAAISLWISIKKIERRSLASYGLGSFRAGKRQLLLGLVLGFAALGLLLIGLLSFNACHLAVTQDHVRLWRIVLSFLPIAIGVSVLEELVFRGFILQHLLRWSRPLAVVVSSALYAAVHLKNPVIELATGLELIGLFLLGAVLALTYLITHQLYLAVGLHASLAYGARVNKLLVEFPDPSSTWSWVIGTNRLVNGLVGWMALLAIGGLVIWWAQWLRQGGVYHGRN